MSPFSVAALVVVMTMAPAGLVTQASGQPPAAAAPDQATTYTVTVIGTTPLPGVEVPLAEIPAPVQTATALEIRDSGAADLSEFLNRRLNGVHVNEIQNNPFQPDVSYRGFTASPLLGTPQGLSVYLDGVRLNQPFGDVVSWDLIPRLALESTTLMPGSNPLFGLNTLGGALALQTKDGLGFSGATVQATYGSDARRDVEFEHGGHSTSQRLHWYVAGSYFDDDGWRDASPSLVRQLFGKVGWRGAAGEWTATVGHADNSLTGNGFQEQRLLAADYRSVFTTPDTTDNRSSLVSVSGRRQWGTALTLTGTAYYRRLRADTLNGDVNEDALDQSIYQPSAAERAALAAAGYGTIPASGLDAVATPFPRWRCLGNVLLNDEPAEKCTGLLNRTTTRQHNGGISGQVTRRSIRHGRAHLLSVGAVFDVSRLSFGQSAELGYVDETHAVVGVGAFGDGGVTGGEVDGEPFDARVDLHGRVSTWSVYGSDVVPVGGRTTVTLSARYNHTTVVNEDRLNRGGGPDSLDGNHSFARVNPAIGVTLAATPALNLYAGASLGSRAPTSVELGCANPDQPCRLPNAMAGDPPLDQVVTGTVEAGLRGTQGRLTWHAGGFWASNRHDILFVTAAQTGFGYFTNVGETRRRGVEGGVRARLGPLEAGAEYTFLRATFESAEQVLGASNSANDAEAPGLEGAIEITRGNRLPLVPQHLGKMFADIRVGSRVDLHAALVATGGALARGNENNAHQPDGVVYLGAGRTAAYGVATLGARVGISSRVDAVAQVTNLFDRRYETAAQLGPVSITPDHRFVARPLPAVNGEFPLVHSTFVAPGAPRRAWIGFRLRL